VISSNLRKRNRNKRYNEDDNLSAYKEESKASTSKPPPEAKSISNKPIHTSKNRKDPEVHFSSDEEMEVIKKSMKDIDFKNLNNSVYTAKHLLEKPEELEDLDLKQYYHNPVR
jgi:hypothetical protein